MHNVLKTGSPWIDRAIDLGSRGQVVMFGSGGGEYNRDFLSLLMGCAAVDLGMCVGYANSTEGITPWIADLAAHRAGVDGRIGIQRASDAPVDDIKAEVKRFVESKFLFQDCVSQAGCQVHDVESLIARLIEEHGDVDFIVIEDLAHLRQPGMHDFPCVEDEVYLEELGRARARNAIDALRKLARQHDCIIMVSRNFDSVRHPDRNYTHLDDEHCWDVKGVSAHFDHALFMGKALFHVDDVPQGAECVRLYRTSPRHIVEAGRVEALWYRAPRIFTSDAQVDKSRAYQ